MNLKTHYELADYADYLLMRWSQANKNMSAYWITHTELVVVRGWDYVRRQLERQWAEAAENALRAAARKAHGKL